MLAIRLQRVGRKGLAIYRVSVQESRRHPSSGRIVADLGSYNPHTKQAKINLEVAQKFLDNGAQPSPRAVKVLSGVGVKMPLWLEKQNASKSKKVRNADKLRKNKVSAEAVEVEVA